MNSLELLKLEKTTAIRGLADFLTQQRFTVANIRESAEIVPNIFPKGDYAANLWMRLNTTRAKS